MQAIGGVLELFILATAAAAIAWFLFLGTINWLMTFPAMQALADWLARREIRAFKRKHGPHSWPFKEGK